jgi:hypothetical protein
MIGHRYIFSSIVLGVCRLSILVILLVDLLIFLCIFLPCLDIMVYDCNSAIPIHVKTMQGFTKTVPYSV